MSKYVIAVTGHRDVMINDALKDDIKQYLEEIAQQYEEVVLLSPLAVGADTLVAQVFLTLKKQFPNFRLEVPLPLTMEKYMASYSKEEEKVFSMLLNDASSSYVIPNVIADPYQNLGIYLVTHAEVLLALWDGTESGLVGGTADVVAYAKSQNKPIKHLLVQRLNN